MLTRLLSHFTLNEEIALYMKACNWISILFVCRVLGTDNKTVTLSVSPFAVCVASGTSKTSILIL